MRQQQQHQWQRLTAGATHQQQQQVVVLTRGQQGVESEVALVAAVLVPLAPALQLVWGAGLQAGAQDGVAALAGVAGRAGEAQGIVLVVVGAAAAATAVVAAAAMVVHPSGSSTRALRVLVRVLIPQRGHQQQSSTGSRHGSVWWTKMCWLQ